MSYKKEEKELKDFSAKISQVKKRTLTDEKSRRDFKFSSGWGLGVRLATELLGGVVVGAGIGLVLDNWLNTAPIFLIIFLLLGSVAGILNVYRVADKNSKREQEEDKKDIKKEV